MFKRLAFALLLFAAPAYAETKMPVKAGPVSGIFSSLLQKLSKITLEDLQAAQALANAHGNKIGSLCYGAWIQFLQAEQVALIGPDGKPITLPPIHIIFDAEKLFDITQALQPTSALSVACAPLKNAVSAVTIPLPLP